MKKILHRRVISLAVVFALIAALIPLFIVPAFAADASKVNIFSLSWDVSVSGLFSYEVMAGSPFTIRLVSSGSASTSIIKLSFLEPIFLSDSRYTLSYFFNSRDHAYSFGSAFKPSIQFQVGDFHGTATTVGDSSTGFSSVFNTSSVLGSRTPFTISFFASVPKGEYYLTFLSFDGDSSGNHSLPSDFEFNTDFNINGVDASDSCVGSSFSVSLTDYGTSANNPQFQKFLGDSTLRMFGGLDYGFFDCTISPILSSAAPDWLARGAYGSLLYFDLSISMPGTMIYIDVCDKSTGKSIPYELCYFAADSVQNVDTIAGTLKQQIEGSSLAPIGGSIAGGLVAVQPTGSKNVNYVLSTNYNAGGASGDLDYSVDYGYRDTTYFDSTPFEYDATSSFLAMSRVHLSFKADPYLVRNNNISIHLVCMDNLYVNYERTFTTAGILNANSSDCHFVYNLDVTDTIGSELVSFDAEYLADRMDKTIDEVMSFLERFYPSSKSIVEFNQAVSDLNNSAEYIDNYQYNVEDSLDSALSSVPTITSATSNYIAAMLFVSHYAQLAADGLGSYVSVLVIPILIGIFFFILQRVGGVTHIRVRDVDKDIHDKGGGK